MIGPPDNEQRPRQRSESAAESFGGDNLSVTQAASVDLLRLSARGREIWDAAWRSGYLQGREIERAEVERREALLWQQAVRIVHNLARLPEAPQPSAGREAERQRLLHGPVREGRRSA